LRGEIIHEPEELSDPFMPDNIPPTERLAIFRSDGSTFGVSDMSFSQVTLNANYGLVGVLGALQW
jgi:hypothetical protein